MGPGCQKGTWWDQDKCASTTGMKLFHYFNNGCSRTRAPRLAVSLATNPRRVATHARNSALCPLIAEPALHTLLVLPLKTFILMNPICMNKQNQMPLFSSENYPEPNCGRVPGQAPGGEKR